jgi:hypothetical protein
MSRSSVSLSILLAVGCAACGGATPSTSAPASANARSSPSGPPGIPWLSEPVDPGAIIDWEDGQYLQAGIARDKDDHTISFTAAVNHTENGKLAEGVWERWELWCSDAPAKRGAAASTAPIDCSLDWLTIANAARTPDSALMTTHHFDSRFGEPASRITDVKADWSAGTLAFTVPNRAGLASFDVSPTRVDISFKQVGSTFYLTDLHAVATERVFDPANRQEHPVTYDYRLADYTQVLNVPTIMPGLRSAGQHGWNTLVASLNEADRTEWKRFSHDAREQLNTRINDIGPETEKRGRAKITDYDKLMAGARKMTPDEVKWLADLTSELSRTAFRDWLATSKLSSDAQKQMSELFARGVSK